jgi:hypothetical protein
MFLSYSCEHIHSTTCYLHLIFTLDITLICVFILLSLPLHYPSSFQFWATKTDTGC